MGKGMKTEQSPGVGWHELSPGDIQGPGLAGSGTWMGRDRDREPEVILSQKVVHKSRLGF